VNWITVTVVQRFICLFVLLFAFVGCVRQDESLVLVGGSSVPAARIDSDPIGLLPSGAIMVGRLDGPALFATSLGNATAEVIAGVLPLGRESNFDAARDVQRAYGAFYAMQGADFCAVLQGNFDVASIARAAELRAATPSGRPLIKTRYAGYAIYTVANLGFAILTPRTILSGDETGMRRALDRLRYGKLDHALAPWMEQVLADPKPAFAAVGDLEKQGVVKAAAEQLPFLGAMSQVRLIGNFKAPGMNVVGTLGYIDADAANRGAASLTQLRELAMLASFFASFGGGATPTLDVRTNDRDVSFAATVDTALMQFVLGALGRALHPTATGWVGG